MYYSHLYLLIFFNIYVCKIAKRLSKYSLRHLVIFVSVIVRPCYYNIFKNFSSIQLLRTYDIIYLWNTLRYLYIDVLNGRGRIYNMRNKFYLLNIQEFNTNILLFALTLKKRFIPFICLNNFVYINYLVSRLYMYFWKLLVLRNIYFYFVTNNSTDLLEMTTKRYFYYASSELKNLLIKVGLSYKFIFLLVKSFYIRDMSLLTSCIRRFIIYAGQRHSRRMIFVIYLFIKTIFKYLRVYCRLIGYRIILKGKVGMFKSRRKITYLLSGGRSLSCYNSYRCYHRQQICLMMGVIGISGFFIY